MKDSINRKANIKSKEKEKSFDEKIRELSKEFDKAASGLSLII